MTERPDHEWSGIGERIEVSPGRQIAAEAELENRYNYAVKAHTHLWIIHISHFASDKLLEAMYGDSDETPILDSETLAIRPIAGCYICEEPYSRRLHFRKCKGEPKR